MDRNKVIKNIKDGGSMVIYVGTAALMKPYITRDNDERNAVGKVCSIASGTVMSLGIANWASKFFGKLVDEVADFVDDVKTKKHKDGGSDA